MYVEIYEAFYLDVAQGHMKGAPNENFAYVCVSLLSSLVSLVRPLTDPFYE